MQKGPFAQLELPECTSDFLISATEYANPPSGTPSPKSKEDFLNPRRVIGMTMFRRAITAEFLLSGLTNSAGKGELPILSFPGRETVSKDEVDKISKLTNGPDSVHMLSSVQANVESIKARFKLCTIYKYPPTCLILGMEDELFDISHLNDFAEALESTGTNYKTIPVQGKGHAFDIFEAIGGDIHQDILKPAVAWIAANIVN